MNPWRHRVAPSPAEALPPREMDWPEAQEWCNFVLFRPARLPPGWREGRATLRPEAPPGRPEAADAPSLPAWTESNRAVHRCELQGPGGTRLRLKQFLYDYAPPAFDHPSLWRSPRVEAAPVGEDVAWSGTDFRGRPAASLIRAGTTLELSCLDGELDAAAGAALWRALEPADEAVRLRIDATPLAELCYQRRHAETAIAVPLGYHRHVRAEGTPVTPATAAESSRFPGVLPEGALAALGYRLDSVFAFGPEAQPWELDHAFRREQASGGLRLLLSPADQPRGVPFRPAPEERQPGQRRVAVVAGAERYLACADERFGQHEAYWAAAGYRVALFAKPTPATNATWFERLLPRIDGILGAA